MDQFMENLRRRGYPTVSPLPPHPCQDALLHPNTIPLRSAELKKVQVVQGRLKAKVSFLSFNPPTALQAEALPRVKTFPNSILSADTSHEQTFRREDTTPSSIFLSTPTPNRRIEVEDEEPSSDLWSEDLPPVPSSNYGARIQEEEPLVDLDATATDRNVFTDEDLKLLVGLVKPLVADLKGDLTTSDDRTTVEQNKPAGIDAESATDPSDDPKETTTNKDIVISDDYSSGEDKVTTNMPTVQVANADIPEDNNDTPDEPVSVTIKRLPENIAVMSLVTDAPETLKEPENLYINPVYMARRDRRVEEEREEKEEVFLLPAGHGLQFKFRLNDLGGGRRLGFI